MGGGGCVHPDPPTLFYFLFHNNAQLANDLIFKMYMV